MGKEELVKAFKKFDLRGDGTITKKNLRELLTRLNSFSEDELKVLFGMLPDTDVLQYEMVIDTLLAHSANAGESDGTQRRAIVHLQTRECVSNESTITKPKEPTLIDNTLLFLPEKAAHELGLEPNMDDKGAPTKDLWYGRVWELRELLAAKYKDRIARIRSKQQGLTDEAKKDLDTKMANPATRKLLTKLAAHWKGAAVRLHSSLHVLERLKFANLRGTLVYAHGSGGCSWDNFRICRMIAQMGIMVIAPDGFAYSPNTAMGQIRHKDLLPLKKATDNVDYWVGDLMYASGSKGTYTYSTKADAVLDDAEGYRDLYEKCYQLRRSELHFVIGRLPLWIRSQGFFLGGTSEGGMTIARFDDQRYGEQVMGRFINSFGIEYCYFTPTPKDGELGGQLDVPTLNIIGTKDQYFGAVDSISKIVAMDPNNGYGEKDLTGNGYKTMVRQGVDVGLVCVLENGVHSPCNTHDNFLRQLFQTFFSRPGSIWELDQIWKADPTMAKLVQVQQSTEGHPDDRANVTQVFVPTMPFPNKMSLRQVEAMRNMKRHDALQEQMRKEQEENLQELQEISSNLDAIRKAKSTQHGGGGFKEKVPEKANFYSSDKLTKDVTRHKKWFQR
eukprot:TRINITY_DN95048_c0_g1_i1.p1 TRINITY_DN95048_c0_g1~~TRINITY_DN95048_c0_g1_i1.p1  ORF type:complete len:615 (+),score=107.49 TRINITY_DN95048_c0_g1_i1:125-1969(+)